VGAILATGIDLLGDPFAGGALLGLEAPFAIFNLPIPLESLFFFDIGPRSRGAVTALRPFTKPVPTECFNKKGHMRPATCTPKTAWFRVSTSAADDEVGDGNDA